MTAFQLLTTLEVLPDNFKFFITVSIAEGKTATQVSTKSNDAQYGADKGIDSASNTYFMTETVSGGYAWWRVDLHSAYVIHVISFQPSSSDYDKVSDVTFLVVTESLVEQLCDR